jgi:UDPglucose--hexose-1-phosphate uridylyltransferase
MSEVRVDPLSGHKSIIAAGRATRPGGGLECQPAAPVDPEKDPFSTATRIRRRPRSTRCAATAGSPDTPGWSVRVVPNLYPALTADAPMPEPTHNADLYTAQAASGAHEVIVNAAEPAHEPRRASRPSRSCSPSTSGASGCAPRGRRVPASDRQRAP